MLYVIILTLVCIIVICIISCLLQNYHLFVFSHTMKSLPGPIRLPFIGSAASFLLQKPEEFLNSMIQLCENYSSPFQLWIGPQLLIMIHEPDQVKTLLQNRLCLDKSTMYKVMEPTFGIGLLTAPASEWTRNRKIIAPTFKASMLQKFFGTFVQESLTLTKELEKIQQSGNEIMLLEYLERCTIRISCDTMMGVKMDINKINQCLKEIERFFFNQLLISINQQKEQQIYIISTLLVSIAGITEEKNVLKYRLRNIFVIPDIIFNLTSVAREHRKAISFLHSFVDKTIQQWTNKSRTVTPNDDTTHKSFFDIFMNSYSNDGFTQKEILDNAFTMIFSSSDTIAVTMHFVIFMLANFSEIQQKVYKELLKLYGMKTPISAPVKHEDLQHMHYLDCVIKETLRLFPAIPLIGRQLTEDLKIGDIVISKNTDVLVSFISMYRNEKYWPDPLKFDPDRFLPKNIKDHSYYYTPFSDGPRNCIGIKYAMISMKVILATLIRTFVFKVNKNVQINEIKLQMDIVLSTIEPLKVKIEKRDNL